MQSNATIQQVAIRALSFLRSKKAEAQAEPQIPAPAPVTVPRIVAAGMRNYAFVEWLLRIVTGSLVVNLAIMVALIAANYSAGSKKNVFVQAPPTLGALTADYFKSDGIRFDEVATSIATILPLLHHVDENGSPLFALLQGAVSPDIYREAEAGIKKSMPDVKKNSAIQNLNITSVGEMEADPKLRRVSCYVRGYFSVTFQASGKSRSVPYRAEVLLEKNTGGNLNALPYTLIRRIERIGQAATNWDEERSAAKTRK